MRKPVCLPTRFRVSNDPHMSAFQKLFNVSSCRDLHDIFRLPSDITSNGKESCQHHQTSVQRSFLVFVVEFITNISPTSQHHQAWEPYLHSSSCRGLFCFLTTIVNCYNSNGGIYQNILSQLGTSRYNQM